MISPASVAVPCRTGGAYPRPAALPARSPLHPLAGRASGAAHSRGLRPTIALPALAALFMLVLPETTPGAPRARASAHRPARSRRAAESLPEVLARTFRAYGGLDAILAVGGVHVRATLADGKTAPDAQPRLERLLRPPDGYRSAESLAGLERETVILDGKRAFRDGAEVTGLARADQIRLEAARTFLPAALARGRELLVDRGEQDRRGTRVRLVELALHEQATLTAEIDAASGRILRAVTRVAGRETTVSFRSFRKVGSLLFPFAEDLESANGKRAVTVVVDGIDLVDADSISIQHP